MVGGEDEFKDWRNNAKRRARDGTQRPWSSQEFPRVAGVVIEFDFGLITIDILRLPEPKAKEMVARFPGKCHIVTG